MIKKINYIYQFLYYSSTTKYSYIAFFPILSIVIASITILITLGVMESMEQVIFKRMESAHFTYTGDIIKDDSFFDSTNLNVYNGTIKKCLISSDDNYQNYEVVEVTLLNNFKKFKNSHIKEYLTEFSNLDTMQPEIIIGEKLARKLHVKIGDMINIVSISDLEIQTPPSDIVYISGIFTYENLPIDYESKHAFISKLKNSKDDKIFISLNDNQDISSDLIQKYKLVHWEHNYKELLGAIRLEKLLYSTFGYFVIFLAALSSISLMSLFVIKKTKQLAILKTLGCKDLLIIKIFIFNAIITSILGVLIGSSIYLFISLFDSKYYIIKNTFFTYFPKFSIEFNYSHILIMIIVSSLFMIIAAIYPILKIRNINLINSLNNKS